MIERRFHHARRVRGAFTLLEVMLTLVLMVMVTALAWPALEKPFATVRLRAAADEVRAAWTTARVAAINTGEIHLFRFVPEADLYRIECYATLEDAGLDPSVQNLNSLAVPQDPIENHLPKGTIFRSVEIENDSHQATTMANVDAAGLGLPVSSEGGGDWSDPILFYPDGTTSTGWLVLKNEEGQFIEVAIRGLTGVINITSLNSSEMGEF